MFLSRCGFSSVWSFVCRWKKAMVLQKIAQKCSFIYFWEGFHFIYYPFYWSLLHLGVTQQNSALPAYLKSPASWQVHWKKCMFGEVVVSTFFKGRTCCSLLEVLHWSLRKWVRCMEHAKKLNVFPDKIHGFQRCFGGVLNCEMPILGGWSHDVYTWFIIMVIVSTRSRFSLVLNGL